MLCVDYGDRDRWDDGDRMTIDQVNSHGLSCITVGPTTDAEPPPYVFTTGMWHSHRQPELALYGIGNFEVMVAALNEIARQATHIGRPMRPGDEFSGALATRGVAEDDYWVTLMPVHPSWFHSQFGTALSFNRDNDVDFLQVVWPDQFGRLPSDVDFDSNSVDRQPMLWVPAAEHPPSVWASNDTRAIIPGRYRRVLAEAATAWEGEQGRAQGAGDAGGRLFYAVGMTLDWLHKSNSVIRGLLPDGVEYRASKAFVAWSDREPGAADDSTLGAALYTAAREMLI
jgi:hypothetical protein